MNKKELDKIYHYGDVHHYKYDQHKELCKYINELYISKNIDYGDSFGETFEELGIVSAITRIIDKVNRLKRLSKNDALVKDESIRDTLIDTANYCIMTVLELDKENKKGECK